MQKEIEALLKEINEQLTSDQIEEIAELDKLASRSCLFHLQTVQDKMDKWLNDCIAYLYSLAFRHEQVETVIPFKLTSFHTLVDIFRQNPKLDDFSTELKYFLQNHNNLLIRTKNFFTQLQNDYRHLFTSSNYTFDYVAQFLQTLHEFSQDLKPVNDETLIDVSYESLMQYIKDLDPETLKERKDFYLIKGILLDEDNPLDELKIMHVTILTSLKKLMSSGIGAVVRMLAFAREKQIDLNENECLERLQKFGFSEKEFLEQIESEEGYKRPKQDATAIDAALIDNQQILGRRLSYERFFLDPGSCFMPGGCVGAVSQWVKNSPTQGVNKSVAIPKWEKLNHLYTNRVNDTFFLEQEYQHKIKENYTFLDFKPTVTNDPGQPFIQNLMYSLREAMEPYLLSYGESPTMLIEINITSGTPHALGFKCFEAPDGSQFYRFFDTNAGEFEFDDFNDFEKWFPKYYSIISEYEHSGGYEIKLFFHKKISRLEFLPHFSAQMSAQMLDDYNSTRYSRLLQKIMAYGIINLDGKKVSKGLDFYEKILEKSHADDIFGLILYCEAREHHTKNDAIEASSACLDKILTICDNLKQLETQPAGVDFYAASQLLYQITFIIETKAISLNRQSLLSPVIQDFHQRMLAVVAEENNTEHLPQLQIFAEKTQQLTSEFNLHGIIDLIAFKQLEHEMDDWSICTGYDTDILLSHFSRYRLAGQLFKQGLVDNDSDTRATYTP